MNDDYLWDKSGKPDPQIQELEQVLAPLRYQPRPLEFPEARRRNYLPLAIAATLLIAFLLTGAWLRLRREPTVQPQQQAQSPVTPVPPVYQEVVKNRDLQIKKPVRKRSNKRILTKHEREEALAAKEQLMFALRLASEKLKLAQRRTQGASPNQIKNQHKVG